MERFDHISVIWYFFLYSTLGYMIEVFWCSILNKSFVNRGFLHGPYIPVYGIGALFILLFLHPVFSYPILCYLSAVVLTSLVEYCTGWLLESLFSLRLWDYRNKKLHIQGRVCLRNSLLYGLLACVLVYVVHPEARRMLAQIPERLRSIGASVMLLLVAVDSTSSIYTMTNFTDSLGRVKRLRSMLDSRLELLNQGRHHLMETIERELTTVTERLKRSGKRIFDAFSGIRSSEFDYRFT